MKKAYAIILFLLIGLTTNSFGQCTSCSLSGPSSIQLGTTATFSTSYGSGYSYFWSVTGGLQLMSGNTGTSVTVKGNSGTSGKVTVVRYGNGKIPCSYSKTVSIVNSTCTLSSVSVVRTSGSCNSSTLTYRATPNGSNLSNVSYSWDALGDNVTIINGQGTNTVTIRNNTPGNSEFIGARANVTACGTTKTGISAELCDQPCGQFICELNAFPNPTTKGFNVILTKGQQGLSARTSQSLTLQLLNKHGEIVKEVTTSKTEVFVDTDGIAEGMYFIRATHSSGQSETRSVIIKK